MKIIWIERIRGVATLAVIFLHISMTLITNYSMIEIGGITNFIILDICQLIARWAVPCFIMITGALLLNPQKEVENKKISKYIFRMFIVLLTFGVCYSFLEIFFTTKTINLKNVMSSITNTIQGKTWSHMWYIYALTGLYIITPILKIIINNIKDDQIFKLILIFGIGTLGINTINHLFNMNIENYMLVDVMVLYYITGYYLTLKNNKFKERKRITYFLSISAIALMIGLDIASIILNNENLLWLTDLDNVFVYMFSIGIFIYVQEKYQHKKEKSWFIENLSKYSFAMYLIHPFWINLLYKVLKVTPLNFQIAIGIIIMFVIVTLLTYLSSIILKKIPLINKYV